MTSAEPDPATFKDWEDAFVYPIPVTRGLEKTLRSHAEENRQKLRTIVGASYRDLLGTADRILEMDNQMRLVDSKMGNIGQKSNSKAVERIFSNCFQFGAALNEQKRAEFSMASQMTVLQRCASVLSRLLKRKSSPLLAAKVLVLSRLLIKVVHQSEQDSALLKSLQSRLASQRRRLLQLINQRLADPNADTKVIIEHMCAYSLTTSATPTDILRHFLASRLEAIESSLKANEDGRIDPSQAIQILLKTARVSPVIFPRKLSDSLAKLKEVPLLQQKDIVSLAELELDIHGRWIVEELRNYTPLPRHDELQKPEADKQVKHWTKQGVGLFVRELRNSLSTKVTFNDLINSRRTIFASWPWSNRALPGLDSEEVVDELREILNARMVESMESTTKSLATLLSDARRTSSTGGQSQKPSMWHTSLVTADASNGAMSFKKNVKTAYFGADSFSSAALRSYDHWIDELTSLMAALKTMKEDRWDVTIEDADDDFDIDSRRALLTEDDPRELEDALSEYLRSALDQLKANIQSLIQESQESDSVPETPNIIHVLRMIRDISQRPIGHGFGKKLQITLKLDSDIILPMQSLLAQRVSEAVLPDFEARLVVFNKSSRSTARFLWEGSPALPMQPSTTMFRFLGELTKFMSAHSCDIWPAGTIHILKAKVQASALPILRASIAEMEVQLSKSEEMPNGIQHEHTAANHTADKQPLTHDDQHVSNTGEHALVKDKIVQLIFDAMYLLHALSSNLKPDDLLKTLLDSTSSAAEDLRSTDISRLHKNAAEYWKRTYLMNALLMT